MRRAVVVLSGGTDSAVTLALAKQEGRDVRCVGFDYWQRNWEELRAAQVVAAYYEVPFETIRLPRILSGTLVSPTAPMPLGKLRELVAPKELSPVEVPFRNGLFLAAAIAFACSKEADEVWHGIHAEDGTELAYPDNSPEFLGALAAATYVGTGHRVRLVSPFEWMTKTDVIQIGLHLDVPFQLTYSCYNVGPAHCGTCIACQSRLESFERNNAEDPAAYALFK